MEVTRCSMSFGESHDQITPEVSDDEAFLGILKILIENYGTGSRRGQYHVSISASHTGLPPIHRLHLPLLDSSQHLCVAHLHETPISTDVINGTTVTPLVNSTVTTVTDALLVDIEQYGKVPCIRVIPVVPSAEGLDSEFLLGGLSHDPGTYGLEGSLSRQQMAPLYGNVHPYCHFPHQPGCRQHQPLPPHCRAGHIGLRLWSAIGSVLSFFLTRLLCDYRFTEKWPSVFNVYALISLVWLIGWGIFVFNTPINTHDSQPQNEAIHRVPGTVWKFPA